MRFYGYLDIETTGLSPIVSDLTVVGLCLERGKQFRFIQLVGEDISELKLVRLIREISVLYTYNGARFDLPFIKSKLGIDLKQQCIHRDLMYECWRRNLYGGFKQVERQLGICRKTLGVDGYMAVKLWYDYKNYGNKKSLVTLLKYNREDVLNLRVLKKKLKIQE